MSPISGIKQDPVRREALIVLVGITAGRRARDRARDLLTHGGEYDVFVPALPYRAGIAKCAGRLRRYLREAINPARHSAVHAIVYIAGGVVLRRLPSESVPPFERMVYFRSPIQERVARTMVRRFGRTLSGWLGGRAMVELANGLPGAPPTPPLCREQGLIIEMGRSRLARLLGISAADVSAEEWMPERLLPAATAVLRIPESHDEVYASERVLRAAMHFIREGEFPR
jgi:hypothetical protein